MFRALQLAAQGAGSVSPNPMVGAVIVHQGKIIGEGYHRQYGQAHAEVMAIRSVLDNYHNAAELLRNAVIYVTLEPCAHHGKTPPCADLIIKHQIPQVVIGSPDPFEQVNGKGIDKLRAAGIEVTENILRKQGDFLNRRFLTRIQKQRPYIILKWAETADGYFAPADGSQRWISSEASRVMAHKWRSEEDAILIGKGTALADNPKLDVRLWQGKNPIRIVIDKELSLPDTLHIFNQTADCIVFNSIKTDVEGRVKYIWLENFDSYLPQMIAFQLYLMDIQSVIIEGGAQILNIFIKAGMWDEARRIRSSESWHKGIPAPLIRGSVREDFISGTDRIEIIDNTRD